MSFGGDRRHALCARGSDDSAPDTESQSARRRLAPSDRPACVAPFTDTCCPSTARTASSNPSNAPATRKPGNRRTDLRRAVGSCDSSALTASGAAPRSNRLLHPYDDRADDRRQARARSPRSARCRSCANDTAIQPCARRWRPCADNASHPPSRRPGWRAAADRPASCCQANGGRNSIDSASPRRRLAVPRKRPRTQAIARFEQRIEAPHAAEAAGESDLRQARVRFRRADAWPAAAAASAPSSIGDTPSSASVTRRRCRSLTPKDAARSPTLRAGQRMLFDAGDGGADQPADGIDGRQARAPVPAGSAGRA